MSVINPQVLGAINQFRTTLDSNLGVFADFVNKNCNTNLFSTYNYKLYLLISENVRMDINYLISLNPDYDLFGFPGIHRNIRNSIEAWYDLHNLTKDKNYIALMKYISRNARTNPEEYKHVLRYANELNVEPENKYYKFPDDTKITIAIKLGIDSNLVKRLTPFTRNANAYVHADVFVTPPINKNENIEDLIRLDIDLLNYSFQSLAFFIQYNFQYVPNFNLGLEYSNCMTFLNQYNGYYIIKN